MYPALDLQRDTQQAAGCERIVEDTAISVAERPGSSMSSLTAWPAAIHTPYRNDQLTYPVFTSYLMTP